MRTERSNSPVTGRAVRRHQLVDGSAQARGVANRRTDAGSIRNIRQVQSDVRIIGNGVAEGYGSAVGGRDVRHRGRQIWIILVVQLQGETCPVSSRHVGKAEITGEARVVSKRCLVAGCIKSLSSVIYPVRRIEVIIPQSVGCPGAIGMMENQRRKVTGRP